MQIGETNVYRLLGNNRGRNNTFYWSITESESNEAIAMNFNSGFQTDSNKELRFCVRAVRYF